MKFQILFSVKSKTNINFSICFLLEILPIVLIVNDVYFPHAIIREFPSDHYGYARKSSCQHQ